MAAYDPSVIKEYLAVVDNPPTAAAKGKAFEDLACYLFNGIPGITITAQPDEHVRDGRDRRRLQKR